MKLLVYRSSQGSVSTAPPCRGAVRGREAPAWPGEYEWYVEVTTVEELMALIRATGCPVGLFDPEEDEEYPSIEIFDAE